MALERNLFISYFPVLNYTKTIVNKASGPNFFDGRTGNTSKQGTMNAIKNNFGFMVINLKSNELNDQCGKTNITRTIDRESIAY